jgi:hypothetical protein
VRGLHSQQDDRSRVDPAALDDTLRVVLGFARAVDARGL